MSIYSASINRDSDDPTNRLQIFRSEWTVGDEPLARVEIVNEVLDSDDPISLTPYGFKAIAWTSHTDEDGRQHHTTQCLKVTE